MHSSRECVKLMMNVDSEIEQSARHENAGQLADNFPRRFSVIDDVVAEHYIESLIRKRQRLPNCRYCLRASLPARKQASITDGQRVDTDCVLRSKIEDQPVRATTNLNHTSISFDRLKRLELVTYVFRGSHHRGNDLLFTPANVLCLSLLVGKLAFERPFSKSPARRLTPDHFGALCAFCG
jgi:hypothetical protein